LRIFCSPPPSIITSLSISSARKDRFVYGGCIFVDTAQRIPGHRSSERNFNLLFTNLDMNITRYLHHEVDRRVPKPTYAQPRWIPASLLLDANMYVFHASDATCNGLTVGTAESSRRKMTKFLFGMTVSEKKDLRSARH
jgi:hypothetical protein